MYNNKLVYKVETFECFLGVILWKEKEALIMQLTSGLPMEFLITTIPRLITVAN